MTDLKEIDRLVALSEKAYPSEWYVGMWNHGAIPLPDEQFYVAVVNWFRANTAALRRSQPEGEMATLRVFKPCEKHKDVTSWTVHPTDYAIPAKEVCPVCEEIAYNLRLTTEAEGRKP